MSEVSLSAAAPADRPPLSASARSRLLAILVFAFALRLALAFSIAPVLRSDALEYHEYGLHLAQEGRYYIINHGPQAAWHGMEMLSYRPPGYPFCLAGLYAVLGDRPRAALAAQALLDTLTVLLVFLLARFYLPENPSLLVALLYALHPFYVPMIMTEVLFIFLLMLNLLYWARAGKLRLPAQALGGLAFGAAVLTRPATIIFTPLAAFVLLMPRNNSGWKKQALALAVWGVAAAAVIAPWLSREYRAHGRFVLITSNGGRTFFDGNYLPDTATEIIVKGRLNGEDEVQIDRDFFNLTAQYLQEHPRHAGRMMVKRLRNLWTFDLPSEFRVLYLDYLLAQPGLLSASLGGIIYFLFAVSRAVMAGAFAGMAIKWKERWNWRLLYLIPLLVTAFHFFCYHGKPRYLSPFYPVLSIFFIAALLRAKEIFNHKGTKTPSTRNLS